MVAPLVLSEMKGPQAGRQLRHHCHAARLPRSRHARQKNARTRARSFHNQHRPFGALALCGMLGKSFLG